MRRFSLKYMVFVGVVTVVMIAAGIYTSAAQAAANVEARRAVLGRADHVLYPSTQETTAWESGALLTVPIALRRTQASWQRRHMVPGTGVAGPSCWAL